MTYLLDTDICIYALNGGTAKLEKNFRQHMSERLCVSTITEAELYYGALHSGRPEANWQRVHAFLKALEKIPFDSDAAREFARIRQELSVAGKPIGVMDMLIGAVARLKQYILVTNNTRHFTKISGITVENWMST